MILDGLFSQSTFQCACDGLHNIAMNVDVIYLINTKFGKAVQLVSDVTVTSITKYIGIELLGRSCLLKNISWLELENI